MRKLAFILLVLVVGFLAYHAGIRHAMTDSTVAVYLDGVVEIQLDGNIYQHEAF